MEEAQHHDPVWRDRSDFIIGVDISDYSDRATTEQLWARQVEDDVFELCCIPFFVYNLALGDVVRTSPASGRDYMVAEVIQPSGRAVTRVWFGDAPDLRDDVATLLAAHGGLLEWSSKHLVAVDTANPATTQAVRDYLLSLEHTGLYAEYGEQAQPG